MDKEYYFDHVGHDDDCNHDPQAKTVCEGMYIAKCAAVDQLCAALRAVYALAGENKEVRDIVNAAIDEYADSD